MSTPAGDPRRQRARIPTAIWIGAGVLLVGLVLYWARDVLLPFVLALFLGYLLMPLVEVMSRPRRAGRSTPRPLAAFLALAAFLGVLTVGLLALGPVLAAEVNRLVQAAVGSGGHEPVLTQRVVGTLASWRDKLYGTGVFPPDVQRELNQDARDFVNGLGDATVQGLTRSILYFPRLLELVVVPLLAFYMLADGPRLAGSVRALLPRAHRPAASQLMARIHRVLLEYVRGQLMTSLFIGVVTAVGLRLLGLRMALLVAAVALVVEIIPFFGPLFWGTLGVILALAQAPAGSPLPVLVAIFALVAQQVDSHVIAPMILGRFCRVHPLLLIFSTLLGASAFGFVGMFLAAPVTAVSKETFLFFNERVHQQDEPAALRLSA
ncbi:MAG TPA: AI-2E family transporter [Candidatus Limnocylindrales bacterium]|nr:AI-2E family transporter [Candidatus Limnocylindrales bacterium]